MAPYKLKSDVGTHYTGLAWSVLLLLVGAYFLLTSLWPPSLLAIVWLMVTATGAFFVFRAVRQVQDVRSGHYPVSLDLGGKTFSVAYANGKTETHGYGEVRHATAHAVEETYGVTLEMAERRYDLSLGWAEFSTISGELKPLLGDRFSVFQPTRKKV
jgi:hypothetical protein